MNGVRISVEIRKNFYSSKSFGQLGLCSKRSTSMRCRWCFCWGYYTLRQLWQIREIR